MWPWEYGRRLKLSKYAQPPCQQIAAFLPTRPSSHRQTARCNQTLSNSTSPTAQQNFLFLLVFITVTQRSLLVVGCALPTFFFPRYSSLFRHSRLLRPIHFFNWVIGMPFFTAQAVIGCQVKGSRSYQAAG